MIWWLPSAMSAASSLGGYLARPKTPRFQSTPQGRYLSKTMRQGIYDPRTRMTLLGKAGAEAGNVAQQQTAQTRGYLASKGMGRSIAGARALNEPGLRRMKLMSDYSRDIDTENERSKLAAKQAFVEGRQQYGAQRRTERTGSRAQLFGGLLGAAGQGISGYQGNIAEKMVDPEGNLVENPDLNWFEKFVGATPETVRGLQDVLRERKFLQDERTGKVGLTDARINEANAMAGWYNRRGGGKEGLNVPNNFDKLNPMELAQWARENGYTGDPLRLQEEFRLWLIGNEDTFNPGGD